MLADDPALGYSIGQELELNDWDPIAESVEQAQSVGELLTLFTIQASEHSTATRFFVRTEGARSAFGFEREAEYAEIARARIAHWHRYRDDPAAAVADAEDPAQGTLW